jgi:hypothetical protein
MDAAGQNHSYLEAKICWTCRNLNNEGREYKPRASKLKRTHRERDAEINAENRWEAGEEAIQEPQGMKTYLIEKKGREADRIARNSSSLSVPAELTFEDLGAILCARAWYRVVISVRRGGNRKNGATRYSAVWGEVMGAEHGGCKRCLPAIPPSSISMKTLAPRGLLVG